MALPDLTGQNIQDTYQRVLQTDNGTLRDGTGSLISSLTISDYTLPTADGDANQTIITDGGGNLSFANPTAEATHIEVKNETSETINKGTPIYITGNVGGSTRLTIDVADASDPNKMPAIGLLESTLGPNGQGFVAQGGFLRQITTTPIDGTSTTSNDTVYVKVGGGLTVTKPSGSALIQNIAKVARSHASAGSLIVSSILRTNDVPNLLEGQIFFGSGSNQMYQTHISSALDNTTLNNITISNTGSFGRVEATTISASTIQVDANTIIVGNTSFSEVGTELQIKSGDEFQSFRAKEVNLGTAFNGTGSVQLGTSAQGFVAVNAEPGKFSTVLRAESTAVSGDYRMGSITQKGSGSFAILLDADAPGVRPDAKFAIYSNTAAPGAGTQLFTVSESMETRAYGHLKVDTNITASGDISASGDIYFNNINGGTF